MPMCFTERMASAYTFEGKPTAFERSIFLNGFYTILRTRRVIPAISPQKWRNEPLVQTNEQQKKRRKKFTNPLHFEKIFGLFSHKVSHIYAPSLDNHEFDYPHNSRPKHIFDGDTEF